VTQSSFQSIVLAFTETKQVQNPVRKWNKKKKTKKKKKKKEKKKKKKNKEKMEH